MYGKLHEDIVCWITTHETNPVIVKIEEQGTEEKDYSFVPTEFKRLIISLNGNPEGYLSWAKSKGILICEAGRMTKKKRIEKSPGRKSTPVSCYVIRVDCKTDGGAGSAENNGNEDLEGAQ